MKKIFRTFLFVGLFVGIFAITSKVNAASATITASAKTVTVGKSATVTVKVNAASWNLEVSGEASGKITGYNQEGKNENTTKTYTINATKAGTYKVSLKGDITDGETEKTTNIDPDDYYVTITATESTETKKEDTTKSSKADLSSLGIRLSKADAKKLGVKESNYDFTGFKSSVTEYNTKPIPNDIDSLQVLYTTVDKNAKVKVTGNTNLEVGTNTIKVEVTAADGKTTKTYTIAVTKLATEDSKPGNLIDDKDSKNLYLSSLSIEGLELSPEFSKDVFAYEATIDMDENDLSKVNVNAQAENANATIEITGNTDLQEGENVINVIVKSNDSSEQTVYQITVNKISKSSEIANSKKHINKEHIIIGTFIAIVLIILIILIINHFRNKKYEEENDYTEEDDENKNYNDEYNNRYEELNQNDNFIEDLYKRRNNGETLNHTEKETIEDIENETDRIFNKPKQGETFEYEEKENTFEDDFKPRNKGKHF